MYFSKKLLREITALGMDSTRADWLWQWRMADAIGARIVNALNAATVDARHPVAVTPYYLGLIDPEDASDPIARQCLPDASELSLPADGFALDPFSEQPAYSSLKGVVHRYPDRLLVLCTSRCAVYCRHCTRRNHWRTGHNQPARLGIESAHQTPNLGDRPHEADEPCCPAPDWDAVEAYIIAHPRVREVIFSGGDPLLLDDGMLIPAVERVAKLEQIDALRIGTRIPVVLPMRVTHSLARALGRCKKLWINTQFNHPRELTEAAREACGRLIESGIPVSNQNVVLDGVNDDADTLEALFRGLQRIRVRPYYAFFGDPVAGTAHLRTPLARVQELALTLERRLGGLALPRFVADLPGAHGKVPVERLPSDGSFS